MAFGGRLYGETIFACYTDCRGDQAGRPTFHQMKDIAISPATDFERDWCAALMAISDPWMTLGRGLDDCRTRMHDPAYLLYVAHLDEHPCGFILLQRRGVAGSPYIASIATSKEYRSKGIGSRLLEFAEELFSPDCRHIFLCVSSFNYRARALYERSGYTVVGELKDYVIDGASEFLMHKRLRRP